MSKGRDVPAGVIPPESFRIHPVRDADWFFLVSIARNLPTMQRRVSRMIGEPVRPELLAFCAGAADCAGHKDIFGVLCFARSRLGANTVTHELGHAAFRVCERFGWKIEHWRAVGYTLRTQPRWDQASPEERYCTMLGNLSQDFWKKAYKYGYA